MHSILCYECRPLNSSTLLSFSGTVSSTIMIFLYSWDHNKLVHVLSNVRAEFCRNDVWKYQPSSKVRLHLPGSCSRKSRMDFSTDVASTSLTKLMNFFSSFHPLFLSFLFRISAQYLVMSPSVPALC